jgi:diguanylate cyclase (GGDEF)-like protein
VAGLTIGALLNRGISPAYAGFFTLAIYYIGATQSRSVTLAAIPVAVPCWVICLGGLSSTVAVKIPVTVGVWTLIGLTAAARRATRMAQVERLIEAASIDPLTGLVSRRELPRILEVAKGSDAVVLLDLDDFKSVNDEHGHQAGDDILAELGQIIQSVLREHDVAVRYGGDEIVLVLADVSTSGADATLERLRLEWAAPDRPSFSAGVALCGSGRAAEALQRADGALYRAKQLGRDRWAHAPTGETQPLTIVR